MITKNGFSHKHARYLTKSRFLMVMDCPTKLYYVDKDKYANQSLEDVIMNSLAACIIR